MASAPVPNIGTMVDPQEPTSYTWNSSENLEDQKRIIIKEEAVEVGLRHCEQLNREFETLFDRDAGLSNGLGSTVLGREALEKWMQNGKQFIDLHENFTVSVGVAGPTGSGKTSALNALLGIPELLPTNSQEAATAVPCKVAYNHDNRAPMRFRACVTFRKKPDLKRQLDQFFEDLERRDELREAGISSPEDNEALRNADANLKPTFEMIRIVWGLEEHEIYKMTTKEFLSNEDVGRLLGRKKKYHASNADQLSEKIKPYMDSTTARHTKSGSEFAAWPLIDEVEILVKSDILRNGVVLVDLPGLADSVESRAAVAEAYFSKLIATLIVSPARRAADDSTSVKLMSDHQEIRMKMDGKFHKRSYCIVVSQIDEIDLRSASRTREAKSNADLQRALQEAKELNSKKQQESEKLKNARIQLAKLQKDSKPATSKATPKGVSKIRSHGRSDGQVLAQRADIAKIKDKIEALDKRLQYVQGHITFLCVKERNKFLEGRIQEDFQRRQAGMASDGHDSFKETYDGRVSICPISAKAFWQCGENEKPELGFPTRSYSGVPNLAQWIRTATIPERESHADSLLRELHHHYNVIQTWSRKEWIHSRIHIDRERVEKELFPPIYDELIKTLDKYWAKLRTRVNKLSPLKDRKVSIDGCVKECEVVVARWSYKHNAGIVKIHWITYQANIQRNGDTFVSSPGRDFIVYNWMRDLSDVLLKTIVSDWNKALNYDIPGLAQPAYEIIDDIWAEFLQQLQTTVGGAVPELLPFLEDVMPNLGIIKEQVKDKLRRALKNISKDVNDVPADMVKAIQKKWLGTFKECMKEKGEGSFKKREELILGFAAQSGVKMFNAAFETVRKHLSENFDQLPGVLEGISKSAVWAVRDLITALLSNVALSPSLTAEDASNEKLELQEHVRKILIQWDSEWKAPETASSHLMSDEDFALPNEYRPMVYNSDEDEDEMDLIESSTKSGNQGES
ncbi:hypothetical protein F5Y05DRAFT_406392 [Hypoxylon sp. FL0543]|nr:hypothetical protein F5Y05DRAFT_406392 [Hypoxylon sp. FL0543]